VICGVRLVLFARTADPSVSGVTHGSETGDGLASDGSPSPRVRTTSASPRLVDISVPRAAQFAFSPKPIVQVLAMLAATVEKEFVRTSRDIL